MSSKDLAAFFKAFVRDYKIGAGDTVYKHAGATHKGGAGVGALLDIQDIMASQSHRVSCAC
jgi:hypothetical protein